jgi:hypothetical protein
MGALTLGGAALVGGGFSSAATVASIVHAPRVHGSAGAGTSATWASSNWSGYAETGAFTAISGSWTVPAVSPGASVGRTTSAWYSAAWLGVDGFNNSNLIQTGTEEDYYSGAAHYGAWWEILPAAETPLPSAYAVAAGDSMSASIVETAATVTVGGRRRRGTVEHEWVITIQDTTRGWTFTTTQPYAGGGTSAEWVVEAPSVNGQIATLANYSFGAGAAGAGDFHGASVATTIGGAMTGAALNYANDAGAMVQNGVQVSTPGQPDTATTAFNSAYGPSAPAAPTS